MSLSRRERREYAKKLGILSQKETYKQMSGRFGRSNAAGEYLHTHHLQEVKNQNLEKESTQYSSDPMDLPGEESINPFGFLGKK
jgi:hypothetical protein